MSSSPPSRRARQREAKSLQLTQRVILSVIVAVVFGSFSAVLAAYLAVTRRSGSSAFQRRRTVDHERRDGLATAAILLINRRRPYSPWVLLGLLPMVISTPWILG